MALCISFQPSQALGQVDSNGETRSFSVLEQQPITSVDSNETLDLVLTRLVLDAIPHQYTKDKDWGHQKKRWDGIEWRRDQGRLETKRKWKSVNHGTWKRYSAKLLDPQSEFAVQLKKVHQTAEGLVGFDLHFTAHLQLDARQSKWVKGLQLYSISANGHAKVRLRVSCEVKTGLDFAQATPDLTFDPRVTSADLTIDEFHLDRISKLGGEFSQQVGKQIEEVLADKVKQKQDKLVEKLNRGIDKNRDKMRLSLDRAIHTEWSTQVKKFLPIAVRSALDQAATLEKENDERR